ncbi:protein Smaug homolog 1-like isoform X2 [Mizuhopecten yessoensis]|uniref:protein Smaug homolog 1-like isoform X2 n=1 Tax=Mizuhopecten yessoensis TaxID=6573 RepID=UPI000B45D8BC|nr:protein Smaug homolog 1-like isoform X2 [Mizuhopecten yessoensis]
MKSNNLFRDQVNSVTNLFEKWSECEQTVALCTLFKQISPTQCRFLAQVLDQTDCTDIGQTESEANDPVYIHKLANNDSKEYAIAKLLAHLPLLRTGKNQAKVEYLALISSILGYTIQNGTHIEESRQIISYSLMHPAITSDERSEFTLWIGKLEEQFTYSIHPQQKKPVKDEESINQSLENLNISNNATHKPVGSGRTNGWHVHPPPGEPLVINTMDPMSVPPNGLLITQQNLINQRRQQQVPPPPPPPPPNSSQISYNHTAIRSHHPPLQPTKSAPPNFLSSVPSSQSSSLSSGSGSRGHQPLVRTSSVSVPPCSIPVPNHINDWLQSSEDQSSHSSSSRGRSHSMTSDHAPLSPQSSITSSSSSSGDTHHEDGPQPVKNSFLEEGSGMRDVPLWLKTLRLHKYAYIFQQLTYEEMMNLTEEWLESQNVTKGARTKIVLSLNKLRERQSLLRSLEKEMMDGGSVKAALTEMKVIINTPMKAFSQEGLPSSSSSEGGDYSYIAEGDLVAQFTRVMGKVCTQLLTASRPDDECFNLYLSLIDKCINHEAFTYRQKKLLSTWKQEMQRIYQPPLKYSMDRKPKPGWGNTFPLGASLRGGLAQKVPRQPRTTTQWSFGAKRSIVGGTTSGHIPLTRNTSLNPALFSRPQFSEGKQQVTRTHSAPLRSPNLGFAVSDCESNADSAENYAQLDSLCMSVTEHALGGSDSGDKSSGF